MEDLLSYWYAQLNQGWLKYIKSLLFTAYSLQSWLVWYQRDRNLMLVNMMLK